MIIKISSKDNPSFKYAKKLFDKSSFRKKEEKFIVEGVREIDLCLKSNFTIESIFTSGYNQNKFSDTGLKTYEINQDLIKKIIYRETTEGVFAIVNHKKQDLKSLKLNSDELILILENPEKPGNIGAIMRTYEACGFKNLIVVDSKIDLYLSLIHI